MLMTIGAVVLDVWPFNATETSRDVGGDYVEKPVMGRRPPLEFVGEAAEALSVTARLFPAKLGGLGELSKLDVMRRSGLPQYVMRGDGYPLGWMAVTGVSERSSHLDAQGVGQVIDVDINLKKADAPGLSGLFAVIEGLF